MPSYPKRWNPVDIKIQRLDVPNTFIDDDFREPVSKKKRFTTITLRGQVNFGDRAFTVEERSRAAPGDEDVTKAHVVFRRKDLVDAGLWDNAAPEDNLKKGDKIIEIAGESFDLIFSEIRPESPLRGKFLLIYGEFEHEREERGAVL